MSVPVVFACMVFLQAVVNERGPAFACLEAVESGQLTLWVSPPILAEVRDVLSRPKLQAKFENLTVERVEAFLQKLVASAKLLVEVPSTIQLSRDPDDEPYLNLAIAAGATYLVTQDNDLLDLMNDQAFTSKNPALTILDPARFLQHLRLAMGKDQPSRSTGDEIQ